MRLFVVEPLAAGGMIHYAYQLCTALAEEGATVTLVTSHGYEMAARPHNFTFVEQLHLWPQYDPQSSEPPSGVLAHTWRKARWTGRRAIRAVRLLREWQRLTQYLITERPDIVQFGKINFPFEAYFLRRLRRRGLCLTQVCHEFELREQGGNPLAALSNRAYHSVYANFSALFFNARDNQARFLSLFPVAAARTHVITHGNEMVFQEAHGGEAVKAALYQRYGLAEEEPLVLFFGNLTHSKGLPELLEAFSLLGADCPARLVIAGYPTKYIDVPQLQQLAETLGIAARVTFDLRYIPTDTVGPLMELATAVVYPYRSSTQSGALQVAYTFGRPVVATAVGGLPEVVEDGRSGFLVPPRQPQALADALRRLIDNPILAAEMGAYARHLSETRFAWRPIARRVLDVYESLSQN
jgi:glycosyltransferase involved in cell wall biosynthesis